MFLYDELVVQGVIHGHNSYMMKQGFLILAQTLQQKFPERWLLCHP
jgi:hypothetical protein